MLGAERRTGGQPAPRVTRWALCAAFDTGLPQDNKTGECCR